MSDDEWSSSDDERTDTVVPKGKTNNSGSFSTTATTIEGEATFISNGIKDGVILEQAKTLLSDFGKDARSLVLMVNARRGEPFAPLSGYVLRVGKNAKVVARHLDEGTLFKGRSLVPLFSFEDKETAIAMSEANMDGLDTIRKILEKVTPEWMATATAECFTAAYAAVNDAYHRGDHGDKTRLMEIEPSESCQSSITLVETVRDAEPWLVCELHSIPTMWYVGEAITAAERDGQTLSEFFFQDRMREYYKSQKAVRTIAVRLMRSRIVRQVLGDEVAAKLRLLADPTNLDTVSDTNNGVTHFVTNVGVIDDETEDFIFYSEATEAEMGALIYAGPFREMIWANSRQKATRSIQEAGRAQALPFDMPTTVSRTKALEAAILSHTEMAKLLRQARSHDYDDAAAGDDPFAQTPSSAAPLTEALIEDGLRVAPREEHSPTVFSVRHSFIAGPSVNGDVVGRKMAQHARRSNCILVWRESSLKLPVAVPDEVIDYRMGAELDAVRAVLEDHGVQLIGDEAIANPTLRVVIQALGPVSTLDQLAMWRAAQSALLRPM